MLYVRSPFDDKLDLTANSQDLAQFGCSETVGPSEGDSLWQPGDIQILWVHLELGVGHLGWFGKAQSVSWSGRGDGKNKRSTEFTSLNVCPNVIWVISEVLKDDSNLLQFECYFSRSGHHSYQ